MDSITYLERPQLDRAVLVCAFKGWNDGGEAASLAAQYLTQGWKGRTFGYLDPEEFFDFQVIRPTVRLEDGVTRVIEWPRGELSACRPGGRDVVVFVSHEPNIRWRTFVTSLVEAARDLGCDLVVTLGGFLTDVPHSRPIPVVGSARDEETAARLGLARSRYEGPTGITGVLHDACNRAALPSVSLWAAVPHYLPPGPNPKAALALVQRVAALIESPIDAAPLADQARRWEEEVSRMVVGSEELREYLQRLEAAADRGVGLAADADPGSIPSADAIAAEVERFLRERGDGEG